MIVVDTNIISEMMRRVPDSRVLAWIDDIPTQNVAITAITVSEILYGIGSLPDGRRKRRLIDAGRANRCDLSFNGGRLRDAEYEGFRAYRFDADRSVAGLAGIRETQQPRGISPLNLFECIFRE